MTYAEERAAAIARMGNNGSSNNIDMGAVPWGGGFGGGGFGQGATGGETLDFLSDIYGANTSANNNYIENLARLQQQQIANQGNIGVADTTGRYGLQGTQLQTDAQRYGYDAQRDIASTEAANRLAVQQAQNQGQLGLATTQGQFGLQQQALQNQGQLGVANATGRFGLDIANVNNSGATQRTGMEQTGANYRTGLEQTGATQRTGMEQSGLTNRSIMDNSGADYRTGLTAQADMATKNFGTQVGSDRFGQVWNGAAAPLLQHIFGIKPGNPYETRQAPTLDVNANRPNYGQLASSDNDMAAITRTVTNQPPSPAQPPAPTTNPNPKPWPSPTQGFKPPQTGPQAAGMLRPGARMPAMVAPQFGR